jgi:octaprenyl-diphosphate synthase
LLEDQAAAPVLARIMSDLRRVERIFDDHLATDLPPVMQLLTHVERYRGKMLRPTLVILCALATSQSPAEESPMNVVAAGAVCEMVHMATLVHDDVLDEADTRRRGDTVNRLHGNETAVILGDYLIASAYHLCSLKVGEYAALAIGRASTVMCAGELLQLHHRGDFSLDEPTYFEIVERKTAELIATACELGAHLGGGHADTARTFYEVGRLLGVAFQIQDDVLDVTGSEQSVGKSVGKDLEKGKMTLPVLHCLSNASLKERAHMLTLLDAACDDRGGRSAQASTAASRLAQTLRERGSIAYAQGTARVLVEKAKAKLNSCPSTGAQSQGALRVLHAMADAVVARAY